MKNCLFFLLFSLITLSGSCRFQQNPRIVAFLSDFGTKDDSVAVCKGVMLTIAPQIKIVDITHEVPPFDIEAGARLIAGAAENFPPETIFVAVVDPGVGSERKAIALKTLRNHYFVGPDNGIFSRVIDEEGLKEAREIKNPRYLKNQEISYTFHGRDIFSPVAAHLARGTSLEEFGPKIESLVTLNIPKPILENGQLIGIVDFIEEPYGNVITNIPARLLEQAQIKIGDRLLIRLGKKSLQLPYLNTFSNVGERKPLALLSSRGYLSFSINMGNFAKAFGLRSKDIVAISKTPSEL